MTPNNSEALLQYLISQSSSHKIAANHADKLTPEYIVDFVKRLNDEIYENILKAQSK